MQATARMPPVMFSKSLARRRLMRSVVRFHQAVYLVIAKAPAECTPQPFHPLLMLARVFAKLPIVPDDDDRVSLSLAEADDTFSAPV